MTLKGSQTEQNLKIAFENESTSNRLYLYFAAQADVEGHNDIAELFRSTAKGETVHAHVTLAFLEEAGDPITGMPIGKTVENLKSTIARESKEKSDIYPNMAKVALEEGFEEIAEHFNELSKAEDSHQGRFETALDAISKT